MPATDFETSLAVLAATLVANLRAEVRTAVHEAIREELPEAIRVAIRPTYMTRAEAAEYVGRSVRGLDHLRKSGAIGWSKRGGRVMIAVDDLDAYLDAGRVSCKGE